MLKSPWWFLKWLYRGVKWLYRFFVRYRTILVVAIGLLLFIAMGWGYIYLYIIDFLSIKIDNNTTDKDLIIIGNDIIRTALGLSGAALVITSIALVIIRILETQKTNYLATLHQGINMLYSDIFTKQRGGVEYLHKIAEAHEGNSERVKEIFETFRSFVKEMPLEKREKVFITEKYRHPTIVIKQEVLYKITPKERNESIYKK